ncbi:glucose dehydrogenase [FAD, quinone]-like [Centruroides sculpturatus]|uniref:glucose dehydrogenase [FAD, quinone]-like n=1 Tax=Centruroides sculpturatus TaxID=218467 RepID=UPI000C6CCE3C|nr:glucose dehydrogenase [FAD, quinone]-like [Centruroides sculpturatus]
MVQGVNLLKTIFPILAMTLQMSNRGTDLLMKKFDKVYDYIIVGAGSAGCVLANRLSEDPTATVLLVEAGGLPDLQSEVPLMASHLQKEKNDWQYKIEPQSLSCFGIKDRRMPWPRGKVLGGSSVLNYMLYVRGNKRDFNNWAHKKGLVDWSWENVYPYFLKSEGNKDPRFLANGFHNSEGELTIESPKYQTTLAYDFVEAGKYLGYHNVDHNGPIMSGFSIPQGTIRRGARCSTGKAFLLPIIKRPNVKILHSAFVTKILFDEFKHARGIHFDYFNRSHIVLARREIIVSAGTINSPQLLLLSGIGPKEQLSKFGIPVISNLPVGYNLQDHVGGTGIHFTINEPLTVRASRTLTLPNIKRFLLEGSGPLTILGSVEGLAFVHTSYVNKTDDYPDIEIHFTSSGPISDEEHGTIRKITDVTDEVWDKVYKPYEGSEMITMLPILLRPKSRGYVALRSKNPYEHPVIDPLYFHDPVDLYRLVEVKINTTSIKVAFKEETEKAEDWIELESKESVKEVFH